MSMFFKSNRLKEINKILELDKPLLIFDLDTTGSAISADKIVRILYQKAWANGKVKKDEILLNPEIKISPEATLIHGIKNEDLKEKSTFRKRAQEIWDLFNNCYYAGFNIMNYDLPLLKREFIRVGMDFEYETKQIIDAKKIFNYMVPRTLISAYKYYCNKELKQSVEQIDRSEIITDILAKQLQMYKDASTWDFIRKIHDSEKDFRPDNSIKLYWHSGELYFALSKYKNKKVKDIAETDPEFIAWVLDAEIPEETKDIIRAVINKKAKEKK